MTVAMLANIVTALCCAAVLVQSVRMMRSLNAMKNGGLADMVAALDQSTTQARAVLSQLKAALIECAGSARMVDQGRTMADELGMMIGIADATAERLMTAAAAANPPAPDDAEDTVQEMAA